MRTSRLFRGSGDGAAAIDDATEAPGPDMQAGGSQPVDRCAPATEGHPPHRTPRGTDHPTATRRRPTIGNAPEHEAVGPNIPTGSRGGHPIEGQGAKRTPRGARTAGGVPHTPSPTRT